MKLKSQFDRSPLQRWTALLFVLVITVFGTVQAVHIHGGPAARGANESATHCALCLATHSVATITEAISSPAPIILSVAIVVTRPQAESRLVVRTSFIRPPPVTL